MPVEVDFQGPLRVISGHPVTQPGMAVFRFNADRFSGKADIDSQMSGIGGYADMLGYPSERLQIARS